MARALRGEMIVSQERPTSKDGGRGLVRLGACVAKKRNAHFVFTTDAHFNAMRGWAFIFSFVQKTRTQWMPALRKVQKSEPPHQEGGKLTQFSTKRRPPVLISHHNRSINTNDFF